jgi:predicted O-methyltransferase YrrM
MMSDTQAADAAAEVTAAIWSEGPTQRDRMFPLPGLPHGYPAGWMIDAELLMLYKLARVSAGPILEVGPWLGRSTSAICAGVRDNPAAPAFDTIDFGITSAEEWESMLGVQFSLQLGTHPVADVVYHPGGTLAVLIANLRRNGLLGHTTSIIRGNFLNLPLARRYAMLFCDTTHDEREARLYMPKIAELLLPGAVLVFDDVFEGGFADLICSYLPPCRRRILHEEEPHAKLLLIKLND